MVDLLRSVAANMLLIAFGVLVCAYGELNLVIKGLVLQLSALAFEVRPSTAISTYSSARAIVPGLHCCWMRKIPLCPHSNANCQLSAAFIADTRQEAELSHARFTLIRF